MFTTKTVKKSNVYFYCNTTVNGLSIGENYVKYFDYLTISLSVKIDLSINCAVTK